MSILYLTLQPIYLSTVLLLLFLLLLLLLLLLLYCRKISMGNKLSIGEVIE